MQSAARINLRSFEPGCFTTPGIQTSGKMRLCREKKADDGSCDTRNMAAAFLKYVQCSNGSPFTPSIL
jgi:hypothetical protein